METHRVVRGRLIDHIQLRVRDLDASKTFYRALLGALGREITHEGDGFFVADELFVSPANGDSVTRVHLAFQAANEKEVQAAHAAALAAGGRDNGAPGKRAYHPDYYGAFVLDPDGHNVEAVYHGAHTRSADAIVIDF